MRNKTIKRIEDKLEEYADGRQEMYTYKTAVGIYELVVESLKADLAIVESLKEREINLADPGALDDMADGREG